MDEERPTDESREENNEDAVDWDEGKIPRDRQCPAAHEGKYGIDDDDIQAQDAADEHIGDHIVPIQEVADNERCEEVGKEVNDTEIGAVQENRFFLCCFRSS